MSLLAPIRRYCADQGTRSDDQGLLRSIGLLRLFRSEQTDPERFYAGLAEDAVRQVAEHGELSGRTVVDVGGGGGWFTAAFRARGAHCYLFEPDPAELSFRTAVPAGALVADGYWLPVRDGGADVVFSSNVLEHVPDPIGLIEEMIRVTRPGGLVYLSYTNWYADYFENSVTATRAHKAFCLSYPKWYSEDYWGITASDYEGGYTAWGGPPPQGPLDGSVVPSAAAGSLPFLPADCLSVLRAMRSKWGKQAWSRYGFVDAFHPAANWYDPDVLGIDQGISVMMAENLRFALVWNTFMRNRECANALRLAGFKAEGQGG